MCNSSIPDKFAVYYITEETDEIRITIFDFKNNIKLIVIFDAVCPEGQPCGGAVYPGAVRKQYIKEPKVPNEEDVDMEESSPLYMYLPPSEDHKDPYIYSPLEQWIEWKFGVKAERV